MPKTHEKMIDIPRDTDTYPVHFILKEITWTLDALASILMSGQIKSQNMSYQIYNSRNSHLFN